MQKRTWVVVPTNGNVKDKQLGYRPSDVAIQRLRKALELLQENPEAFLAVCGGKRLLSRTSEAEVAYRYLYERLGYTEVVFRDSSSTYKAGDMVSLAYRLNNFNWAGGMGGLKPEKIIIVTHPDHAKMARRTLKKCKVRMPIEICDSGEKAPYSKVILTILRIVYWLDPKWSWWPSSYFRRVAEKRYFLDQN